jgi:LmbE family N-acetylglucosaminyl deacetylase
VVDVSDVYEQKIAAVSAYQSQFDEQRLARLLHRLRARDADEGARAGFAYGELFALPHPVPLRDPVAHFRDLGPLTWPAYPPRNG